MKSYSHYETKEEKEYRDWKKKIELMHKEAQALLIEPGWYLRSIPYSQYRLSRWWKKRKNIFLIRKEKKCELCDIRSLHDERFDKQIDGLPMFHVHHVTYRNLGPLAV